MSYAVFMHGWHPLKRRNLKKVLIFYFHCVVCILREKSRNIAAASFEKNNQTCLPHAWNGTNLLKNIDTSHLNLNPNHCLTATVIGLFGSITITQPNWKHFWVTRNWKNIIPVWTRQKVEMSLITEKEEREERYVESLTQEAHTSSLF